MDHYTLIVVSDDRSPVRRFQVPTLWVQRAIWGAAAVGLICLLATWDYWRMWADNSELDGLRIQTAELGQQIDHFKRTLADVESELARVKDLERKVRIIANLPGAAAVGGAGVTELVPAGAEGQAAEQMMPPAGVPIDLDGTESMNGQGGDVTPIPLSSMTDEQAYSRGLTTSGARYVLGLDGRAVALGVHAEGRGDSLEQLLEQLEDKRVKLASMPSIWPARGWLTSRFGPRVSPFTGRTQQHSGLDIASRRGTPIISPAEGRVSYVGRKGPLGNALVINHGFGVKTFYGHTEKIFVKPGQKVERGDQIASIGSSGRSTGPHLHYVVEVAGKPRNPLNYIFD
jgi:murein DD-endopeptidase MepM/ murein hydrolase activator NlpD